MAHFIVVHLKGFRIRMLLVLLFGFGFCSPLYAYEVITVNHGGELYGTISFKGQPPANLSHDVEVDADFCGPKIQEETIIVNSKNQGLQNAVVMIEGISQGKMPHSSMGIIENRDCHFIPHVQAEMAGQYYEVRNSDPVMHNTHLKMDRFTLLNIIMPAHGNKHITKKIPESGLIRILCDAHKFMHGWLIATENPYFAVTDHNGHYRISDIPPGKYKIKVWHEALPLQEKELVISPQKKEHLSLEFSSK